MSRYQLLCLMIFQGQLLMIFIFCGCFKVSMTATMLKNGLPDSIKSLKITDLIHSMGIRRDKWKSEPEMDQAPPDTKARRDQKRFAKRFDKLERREELKDSLDKLAEEEYLRGYGIDY